MSHSRARLAGAHAALRTLELPDDWSPAQALAVWELLNELADRIWARYELALVGLIRSDLLPEHDPNQPDLFDPDEPIPF